MDIIRQARVAAGMTQEQLAAVVGVTQGAIAQWENGLTHPSYGKLKPLAVALNLTLDDLIGGGQDDNVSDHPAGG